MKPEIKLRPYQNEAIERALWSIEKFDNNSLIVMPTGAGKSLIISGIADALQKEILILQPSKEILEQNVNKLKLYVPEDEIGVYSASMKRKEINKYNFATIQSIYKVPELFNHIGLVLVDEAHTVDPKRKNSMFTSFLHNIGSPITIGLTATPFRNVPSYFKNEDGNKEYAMMTKLINRMNPRLWNRISYNINNHELVEAGYLTRLRYFDRSVLSHERIPLNKSGTDYDLMRFSKMFEPYETQILDSIYKAQPHRRSILVFCSSVEQARRFSKAIDGSEYVSGETPINERDRIINGFKDGSIKVVFNMGVLTTGFDCPELDCIYLLRPTKSLGLYYQMLGRGVRTADGKSDCYVLDYSGSCLELGAIEDIVLRQEGNLWELYANGEKMHNKVVYEREVNFVRGKYTPRPPTIEENFRLTPP